MAEKYSEEDLSFLTPEERNAVSEEEPPVVAATEEEDEPATETVVDTDDDESEESKADANEGEEAAPAVKEPDAAAAPAVEASKPPARERRDTPMRFEHSAARDFDAELVALAAEYTAGNVTDADYARKLVSITKAQTRDEIVAEVQRASMQASWDAVQEEFLDEHPEYVGEENSLRYAALDTAVKHYGNLPENANSSGRKVIRLAHALVEKQLGRTRAAEPVTPAVTKPAIPRRPDLKSVPTTLAHLPSAGAEDTGGDKFKNIDNLVGLDQEMAIARMGEAEYDEYLRSGNG